MCLKITVILPDRDDFVYCSFSKMLEIKFQIKGFLKLPHCNFAACSPYCILLGPLQTAKAMDLSAAKSEFPDNLQCQFRKLTLM